MDTGSPQESASERLALLRPRPRPGGERGGGLWSERRAGRRRVGQSNGFSRIEFHWKGNVGYTARREGDNVVVRFSRDADPDMARLRVDPPPFLKTASLRRQGKILEVVLTLQPGADAAAACAALGP